MPARARGEVVHTYVGFALLLPAIVYFATGDASFALYSVALPLFFDMIDKRSRFALAALRWGLSLCDAAPLDDATYTAQIERKEEDDDDDCASAVRFQGFESGLDALAMWYGGDVAKATLNADGKYNPGGIAKEAMLWRDRANFAGLDASEWRTVSDHSRGKIVQAVFSHDDTGEVCDSSTDDRSLRLAKAIRRAKASLDAKARKAKKEAARKAAKSKQQQPQAPLPKQKQSPSGSAAVKASSKGAREKSLRRKAAAAARREANLEAQERLLAESQQRREKTERAAALAAEEMKVHARAAKARAREVAEASRIAAEAAQTERRVAAEAAEAERRAQRAVRKAEKKERKRLERISLAKSRQRAVSDASNASSSDAAVESPIFAPANTATTLSPSFGSSSHGSSSYGSLHSAPPPPSQQLPPQWVGGGSFGGGGGGSGGGGSANAQANFVREQMEASAEASAPTITQEQALRALLYNEEIPRAPNAPTEEEQRAEETMLWSLANVIGDDDFGGGASGSSAGRAPQPQPEYHHPREASVQPPNELVCCITFEVMTDPVLAMDGNTYERSAIERWFATTSSFAARASGQKPSSPLTGEDLDSVALIPNHAMRKLCVAWRAAHLDY